MNEPLGDRLRHANADVRLAACRGAVDDPNAALYLEAIADALGDVKPQVAQAASRALIQVNRGSEGVPAVVRAVLRRPRSEAGGNSAARLLAALTLAQIETPSPALLPALVEGLTHQNGTLRWEAARALVDVGRLHAETVTLLLGFVTGGDTPLLRRMAMHCLRELAPDLPDAASALVTASRDTDRALVRAALLAMAGLFRPPKEVLTRLEEARQGGDPVCQQIAERALRSHQSAPAGPETLEAL